MIESLKNWIINICTAIFFVTAVEMILPNNDMKKYAKFVLGLILITILINPIIRLIDKSYNIDTYINEATVFFEEKKFQDDYEKYKQSNLDNTISVFSDNLKKTCKNKLKEIYPKDTYNIDTEINIDSETGEISVAKVNIIITNGHVKKVQKISIGDNSEEMEFTMVNTDKESIIKECISKTLKISEDKIMVCKR